MEGARSRSACMIYAAATATPRPEGKHASLGNSAYSLLFDCINMLTIRVVVLERNQLQQLHKKAYNLIVCEVRQGQKVTANCLNSSIVITFLNFEPYTVCTAAAIHEPRIESLIQRPKVARYIQRYTFHTAHVIIS